MSAEELLEWFVAHNGTIDTSFMGLTKFPAHGRGAIAKQNIAEGHSLFTIPRDLTLSTRTSMLPSHFGKAAWNQFGLHTGWVGLILCMMWEESMGSSSRWYGYLSILPSSFDTPMFWSVDDLRELHGTAVVDKIGRDEAERDFNEKLMPAVKSRPDLFSAEDLSKRYTLQRYHIMGSRILSRSFHVEPWNDDRHIPNITASHNDAMEEDDSSMAVDEQNGGLFAGLDGEEFGIQEEISEEEDEQETEDSADVAMVPIADMLNARFGSENAKLFYEKDVLRMVATKPIAVGEQIWNTYGDPPNSDLLRRYGHVDVVPLSPPLAGDGNPADIVEIRADLVVNIASRHAANDLQARVDWWLEVADDDTFVVGTDCELPEELVSFIRLLLLSEDDWRKAKSKSKLPKPKIDAQVLSIAKDVLAERTTLYSTTIQDDEALLSQKVNELSLNKKHAVIVRLGEKRILHGTLRQVERLQEKLRPTQTGSKNNKKRNRDEREAVMSARGKKAKR